MFRVFMIIVQKKTQLDPKEERERERDALFSLVHHSKNNFSRYYYCQ